MNPNRYVFPVGCIACRPGDYIVCREADGRWRVYRVEDILAVKRLVASVSTPITLSVEEDLLDSIRPAYFEEVQLLLTSFDYTFADDAEARLALQHKQLKTAVKDLMRAARAFPQTDCKVVVGGHGSP